MNIKKRIIKTISIFLMLVLVLQDTAWTSPHVSYPNNALQVNSAWDEDERNSELVGEARREYAGRTLTDEDRAKARLRISRIPNPEVRGAAAEIFGMQCPASTLPHLEDRNDRRHEYLFQKVKTELDKGVYTLEYYLEICPEFADLIDTRPVFNEVLDPCITARDMNIKRIVNPFDKPLIGVYGGAGADVSNFLLSTNAEVGYFVDNNYGIGRRKDFGEYFNSKYYSGFGASDSWGLYNGLCYFKILLEELRRIGVSEEDITSIREKETEYFASMAHGRPFSIEFNWAYKGQESKKRIIHLIRGDITRPSGYPSVLRDALAEGIDFYYQRAGMFIPSNYKRFIGKITKALRNGGFLILDNHTNPLARDKEDNPLRHIKNADMLRCDLGPEEIYWKKKARPRKGYGQDMKVYKKLKEKKKQAGVFTRFFRKLLNRPSSENIGNNVEFRRYWDELIIKSRYGEETVDIEEAEIDHVRIINPIKEMVKDLAVYREFGDEFINVFNNIEVKLFYGTDHTRVAGAFAHMSDDGIIYIDNVTPSIDMVIVHEAIHKFLKDRYSDSVSALRELINNSDMNSRMKKRVLEKAGDNPSNLRHYYARYYLQNPANGKYKDSANENLTKGIRSGIAKRGRFKGRHEVAKDIQEAIKRLEEKGMVYKEPVVLFGSIADGALLGDVKGIYISIPISSEEQVEARERFEKALWNELIKMDATYDEKDHFSDGLGVLEFREHRMLGRGYEKQDWVVAITKDWIRIVKIMEEEKDYDEGELEEIAKKFGIKKYILSALLDNLADEARSKEMGKILLKFLKEDEEITEDELNMLVDYIEKAIQVLYGISGFIEYESMQIALTRDARKELIKRIAIYLSIEHLKRTKKALRVPVCVRELADLLPLNSNFRPDALRIIAGLRGKDVQIADVFLNKIGEAFTDKEVRSKIEEVRKYLYLRAKISDKLRESEWKDRVSHNSRLFDADLVTRYLLEGGSFIEDKKIEESIKRVVSIKQLDSIRDSIAVPSIDVHDLSRCRPLSTDGLVLDGRTILQHVSVYLSGNGDWDRMNLDDAVVNIVKRLADNGQLRFVCDNEEQKETFIALFREKIPEWNPIFIKANELDLSREGLVYTVRTRNQCPAEGINENNKIIAAGENGIVDLYLMWNVVLLYLRSEKKGLKDFLVEYYKDTELEKMADVFAERIFKEGIWIILPQSVPFVRDYYEALDDAGRLISQSA